MRVCVLIPSEDYVRQAGFRIRYLRIEHELARLGHVLQFRGIADAVTAPEDDVYLVSKCYDARAFLAMHRLKACGKLVGIDLFDDYFSQNSDSRFLRLRRWLRTSLDYVDFVLCSTPEIKAFVSRLSSVPTHILNDPAAGVDGQAILDTLRRKAADGPLNVAWFGMGDNPNFPVGLDDLLAHAGELARLEESVGPLRLAVLTNVRALTARALADLSRLSVAHTIEEWSEAAEKNLLRSSHVAFLPVNAQNFSVAKSLNRALTALSAGCQVLSAGYPLYDQLDEFIYRDPEALGRDWLEGRPKLRAETVPALVASFSRFADPQVEAKHVVEFMASLGNASCRDELSPSNCAVVFGYENHADMYNLVRSAGALSVRSPFSRSRRNFDLRVDWSKMGGGYNIYVEARAMSKMSPGRRELFGEVAPLGEGLYARLANFADIPADVRTSIPVGSMADKVGVTASYTPTIRSISWIARYLFPLKDLFLSEDIRLPLSLDADFGAKAG